MHLTNIPHYRSPVPVKRTLAIWIPFGKPKTKLRYTIIMSSITYTVGQLKKLFSNKYQIGRSVWNKLQDLKIKRPFRGSRAGVLVKARSRENEETKRSQRQI